MLKFEEIEKLIQAVAECGLERVEIERSGFRLHIVGRSAPTLVAAAPPVAAAPSTAAGPAPASSVAAVPESAEAEPEDALPDAHILSSPIVGTFYAAPSPDSEPYVRVGDRVQKGQVLCIVEAMKLMNEIESDVDGVVLEIVPKNAQPVEFGEPLFAIETD